MSDPVNEYVARAPHARLRPFIEEYAGYRSTGLAPGEHAGLPSTTLTLIIAFDEMLDVQRGDGPRDRYWAMVGGLHTAPVVVRHGAEQHGVQIRLAPRGAPALFGIPAAALTRDVVHLDAVAPELTRELVDRLSNTQSWTSRWEILDDVFLRVLDDASVLPSELEASWQMLLASDGTLAIEDLAAAVGWSRRHLAQSYRRAFGVSPKVLARIMRFDRAQRMLRSPEQPSLAEVAHICGYADQAHMTREWNAFAGSAPTNWLSDETIPILQDDGDPDPSS